MTTSTLTDDKLVALVQYCGLPGYKAGNGQANPDLDRKMDSDELAIHQLIRESGLPGYDPAKLATRTAATVSPDRPDMATEPLGTTEHRAPAVAVGSRTGALSKAQFLVLDVAPNGETALAALEAKMGVGIAVERRGASSWVAAPTGEGGSRRAFSFMAGQLAGFADLLGELGTPALRLSVTGIELSRFKAVGALVRDGDPPQWPDSLNKSLRAALGKVR